MGAAGSGALVTIGLARLRLLGFELAGVQGRALDARKPERRGPARHAGERVERRGGAGELREKDRRPPDCLHRCLRGQTYSLTKRSSYDATVRPMGRAPHPTARTPSAAR